MAEQTSQSERAAATRNTIPHWYDPAHPHLEITRGEGAYVYDSEGNRYLDGVSQLFCTNAGHDNQAIIEAMTDQLGTIPYVTPSQFNDTRDRLSDLIIQRAPGSMSDIYYAISGSEANESAVHFAREYTGAQKILTRWRSYHGGTYGTSSLTGNRWSAAIMERHAATTGGARFLPPLSYRSPFDARSPEELAEKAADHLEFVIRNEGPESVAAVLSEPVAGASGAYPAPPGYFERVREICDEYDVLLIADEVITGFGRCGSWFTIASEGVDPDIVTFAKGVTSAYAPLAGVMVSDEIGEFLRNEGVPIGQTFAGHPVACAAGVATIEEYEERLMDNVRALAPDIEAALTDIAEDHDVVGDVRGRGFLWSIEFATPGTEEPIFDPRVDDGDNPVEEVATIASTQGGALFWPGRPQIQILVSPPFCIDGSDVDHIYTALDGAISTVFG